MTHLLRSVEAMSLTYNVNFNPIAVCSPKLSVQDSTLLKAITDVESLLTFLRSEWSTDFEFWLFVDDAQTTYDNERFWHGLTSSYEKRFYVIAAGCYGSNAGTFSHSPPRELLPLQRRIHLFPFHGNRSPDASPDQDLCIAFTKDDFENFATAVSAGQPPLQADVRKLIMEYASPYPPVEAWSGFLHPGVVAELIIFLSDRVCHIPYSAVSLI